MFAKTLPFAAIMLAGSAQAVDTWSGQTCPTLSSGTTDLFLQTHQDIAMAIRSDGKVQLNITLKQKIASGTKFDKDTSYEVLTAIPNDVGSGIESYDIFKATMSDNFEGKMATVKLEMFTQDKADF